MKKMLMAAVALIFTAGILKAQQTPAMQNDVAPAAVAPSATVSDAKEAQTQSKPGTLNCDMKNCFTMKNGKMCYIKNGKESPMTVDMKTSNGDLVLKNGSVIKADGSKSMLKEGQCIDMSGNMGKTAQSAKSAAPANKADAPPADNMKK